MTQDGNNLMPAPDAAVASGEERKASPAPGVRSKPAAGSRGKSLADWHPGLSSPSVYGDGGADTFSRSRMPRSPHWSVPWSDLMMTMFIFFAVLYIYQSAHRDFELRGGEGVDSEMGSSMGTGRMGTGILGEGGSGFGMDGGSAESIAELYDVSKQLMEKDFAEVSGVDLVPDKAVKIILTSDLLFDLGKADLKPKARELLGKVAGVLRQSPYPISVIGHTDSTPIHSDRFPTNWELSAIRATVVARYMIEEMRLPGKRFTIVGHAFYRPVRPNNSVQNKAMNRRVEIIISKDDDSARAGDNSPNKEEQTP